MLSHLFSVTYPGAEIGTYQWSLVLLSYLIATFAAYTTLSLTEILVKTSNTREKRFLHWVGALALGSGIWSMHFIGMMAYHMHMPMNYDFGLTFISMLVAVGFSYGVLAIVSKKRLLPSKIILGGTILGIGISGMHYIGMMAMQMDADVHYIPSIFILSIIIAIGASAAALWISFHFARHNGGYRTLLQITASLIMAAAVCGMHYTGMAAEVFIPHHPMNMSQVNPDDHSMLGFAITVAVSLILGLALSLTIYRQENKAAKQRNIIFPLRLLALSLTLTIATILWVGGNSLNIYSILTHNVYNDLGLSEVSDEIVRLDGVLTESARMYAITGDKIWKKRYLDNVDILDNNIKKAMNAFDQPPFLSPGIKLGMGGVTVG